MRVPLGIRVPGAASTGSASTTSPTSPPWRTCCATTRSTARSPAPSRSRARRSSSTASKSRVYALSDPSELPWAVAEVDVALECTGRFRSRADAAGHLAAGARKVIISAPGKDVDVTLVRGVNEDAYDPAVARRDLECVLHDQLPRARRDDPERRIRHQARDDDDDPRLHGGSAPRRPAAQGSPSRPRRRGQHRPDVDRCGQGAAAGHPRARRQAPRRRCTRSRAYRLVDRPDGRARDGDDRSRRDRRVR